MSAVPRSVLHCVLTVQTGGLEVMLLNLTKATDRSRFTPRVVCLHGAGELAPRFEEAGVPVEVIDRPASGGRGTLASLIRYLRHARPDILHSHNRGAHQQGAFARRAAGIAIHVHTRHDRSHATTLKSRWIERTATRLTDMIVPVSEDAATVAREFDGARRSQLRVIPNGVDLDAFMTTRPELPGWRVVHVARLDTVKDQVTLLRAAALIAATAPGFHLDIVGDGPERSRLELMATELNLQQVVTFHGMQTDVRPFLFAADLFVLSSTSEGLAMTLLEAMAASLPIVATDVGGNREAVVHGETGLLVPSGNAASLADAITATLGNPRRARSFGLAARQRALHHYSLTSMTAAYQNLYDELIAEPHATSRGAFAA